MLLFLHCCCVCRYQQLTIHDTTIGFCMCPHQTCCLAVKYLFACDLRLPVRHWLRCSDAESYKPPLTLNVLMSILLGQYLRFEQCISGRLPQPLGCRRI